MAYLDDIWYVGGPRAKGAHAEFWAWHMLIKYLTYIIYAKTCLRHFLGPVCPTLMISGMWVGRKVRILTFAVICWSPGTPGVKNVKQGAMTTKFGQKNH